MKGAKFREIQFDDDKISRFQDETARCFDLAFSPAVTDGVLLTSQAVGTSTTAINHGLGRNLRGWIVVRNRANAVVWDAQDSNTTPALTLNLKASAATTVDLWVF